MNSETGRLYDEQTFNKLSKIEKAKCTSVEDQILTASQKTNMQVSPFDNKSQAGKIRIKTYNNLRNKPCVCGSGKKFKKCCWYKMNQAKGRH